MSKTGIELIAQERQEQIQKHGRTVEQDVIKNVNYELRDAAVALIYGAGKRPPYPSSWDKEMCEKMDKKSYAKRLVIAGACIAAELDRLSANGIAPEN